MTFDEGGRYNSPYWSSKGVEECWNSISFESKMEARNSMFLHNTRVNANKIMSPTAFFISFASLIYVLEGVGVDTGTLVPDRR